MIGGRSVSNRMLHLQGAVQAVAAPVIHRSSERVHLKGPRQSPGFTWINMIERWDLHVILMLRHARNFSTNHHHFSISSFSYICAPFCMYSCINMWMLSASSYSYAVHVLMLFHMGTPLSQFLDILVSFDMYSKVVISIHDIWYIQTNMVTLDMCSYIWHRTYTIHAIS